MALLRITNLKKSYNITKTQKQDVLKGVDIEFKSGDLVALLGESGSGKSTLINIIGGLDMDYTGSIVIKGDYIRDFSEKELDDYRKKRVGLIFQNYNLIGHMTILENVELAMSISDIDEKIRKERALDLLKMVGLGNFPDKYPNQLSGGQKQRVAIARALANNPTIILADEPTGALDKDSAELVMKILKKISESGKLVIIVTHSQKVAEECGRIIKLDNGVIVDDYQNKKLHIDKHRDKEIVPKNMKKKDLFKRAIQNTKRNKRRSMLTSVGMAVGICAMMLILCLSSGLTKYVNNVYSEKGTSLNLIVQKDANAAFETSEIDAINEVSGVYNVTQTTLISNASIEYSDASKTGKISGYYSAYAADVLYGNAPSATGEVLVGSNLANQLSSESLIALVGGTISLTVGDTTNTFKVVGIYDSSSRDYLCYVYPDDISLYSDEDIEIGNYVYVTFDNATYVTAGKEDIEALGFKTTQEENIVSDVLEYIDLGTTVLSGVGAISMVVSAIMIFIVLYISVTERIKEIGILRSIGARKKDIKRMFIYEAGVMGLLGGIMAVVACFGISLIVNIICSITLSYALISYNVLYYLLGLVLSTGISILAGIAPSMRAADLDPVECLRAE